MLRQLLFMRVLDCHNGFGYTDFTLESNCKGMVDQLKSRSGFFGPLGHVHRKIFTLIDWLHVILSFARQSTNVPAHLLASQAVSNYPSNIYMKVVPHVISANVQADIH